MLPSHLKTGALGEDIACKFLVKNGLEVVERNYWRKWGEIDIISRDTSGVTHFVEVKSTSKPFVCNMQIDDWRPEEMIHKKKVQRLKRVIQTYILQHNIEEWVFDVVVVYLNEERRIAKCKIIKDIVL